MEDTPTKNCARCGQPVNRAKDSWRQEGDRIVHAACPTSPELRDLPAATAALDADQPQFITMAAAAKMVSVSVDTIRRRIPTGDLRAYRLRGASEGGRQTILINRADILGLLEPYDGNEPSA